MKEFGKPEWAQAKFSSITPSPTPPSISTPSFGPTIQMTFTLAEYEVWKQSQASTSSANLASTSGTHVFLASRLSWVIDSGALAQMTGTPSTLSSLTLTIAYPPISIEDGRSCSVKGYESTKPTPSLTLYNVLYVPGFPTNLLSISTIIRTLNCVVIVYPFHCVFQDLHTGQRIGLGCENGRGIYELMSYTPSSRLLALVSSSSTTSSILWHRRLGHPCLSKLKKTLPWLSLNEFVYESCQMSKHHRSTYPACDSIPSSCAFDLIHCDVWGPSRVPFLSGHVYYIVLLMIILESAGYISSKTVEKFLKLFTNLHKKLLPNIPPHQKLFELTMP